MRGRDIGRTTTGRAFAPATLQPSWRVVADIPASGQLARDVSAFACASIRELKLGEVEKPATGVE